MREAEHMREAEFKVFRKELLRLLTKISIFIEPDEKGKSKPKDIPQSHIDEVETAFDSFLEISADKISENSQIRDRFWNRFQLFIDGLRSDDLIQSKVLDKYPTSKDPVPIAWGYWNFLHSNPVTRGYSDHHVHMIQDPSNPSGRHVYKRRPKEFAWDLVPVKHGGKVAFYTTSAPINQIDAVSSVPSIKEGISVSETSRRIQDPRLKNHEWQRELQSGRLVSIGNFLDEETNTFANSVMLFSLDHPSVKWEGGSSAATRLKVDFNFLKEDPNQTIGHLTDHHGSIDKRPIAIIDGQHRIRGGMMSDRGHKQEIPIILIPKMSSHQKAAKYFAEINTLSVPLDTLHEMFMRHKFALSSHKPGMSYAHFDPTKKKKTRRDRANRLAYEVAAYLNLHGGGYEDESGALQNLILMLKENTSEFNKVVYRIDLWVKHSYPWFMDSGPYGPPDKGDDKKESKDQIFLEISNYFEAFRAICNDGWEDGLDRWLGYEEMPSKGSAKGLRPLIQFATPARSLLDIFPLVYRSIKPKFDGEVISIEEFRKSLAPLGNIDWLNSDLINTYSGSGEYPWQSLRRWMKDALGRGIKEPYSKEEIVSETLPSERGKGMLSEVVAEKPVASPEDFLWPTPEEPVTIIATRPINARKNCEGRLWKNNNEDLVNTTLYRGRVRSTAEEGGYKDRQAVFTIHWWPGIEELDELKFHAQWGNQLNKGVNSTITLKRP